MPLYYYAFQVIELGRQVLDALDGHKSFDQNDDDGEEYIETPDRQENSIE